jgi:hypothetical protein
MIDGKKVLACRSGERGGAALKNYLSTHACSRCKILRDKAKRPAFGWALAKSKSAN